MQSVPSLGVLWTGTRKIQCLGVSQVGNPEPQRLSGADTSVLTQLWCWTVLLGWWALHGELLEHHRGWEPRHTLLSGVNFGDLWSLAPAKGCWLRKEVRESDGLGWSLWVFSSSGYSVILRNQARSWGEGADLVVFSLHHLRFSAFF